MPSLVSGGLGQKELQAAEVPNELYELRLGTTFASADTTVSHYFMHTHNGEIEMSEATTTRSGVRPNERQEGYLAKMVEEQTARVPSDVFLWAAGGSIVGSMLFQIMGEKEKSLFVGQWAPTFLILGLYNKLVKVLGSE